VVGARGFLGSALVETLHRRDIPVVEYTRDRPYRAGDVLDAGFDSVRTVVWCASSINPYLASQHPELVEADRVEFARFLQSLEHAGTAARVVLVSSGGTVYGDAEPPHSETTVPRPTSAYGHAKLTLERMLHEARPSSVVVRVANAYGPGQPAAPGQGVVGHWLRALVRDEPVTVYGTLDTVRDYVYVDDIAAALVAVHEHTSDVPSVLNVGSGRPTSLAELVEVVQHVAAPHRLQVTRLPGRPFDLAASWLSVDLARRSLGWEARTSLVDGVRAAWEWVSLA